LFHFEYVGSELDDNGYLLEPFALIPMGWLIMSLALLFYLWEIKKNKPHLRLINKLF
jgi:hypothetical protein